MWKNTERIFSDLGKKDERLAKIFSDIIRDLKERLEKISEKDNFNDKAKSEVETAIRRSRHKDVINQYPGNLKDRCRKVCVGLAFNQWNSSAKNKPGFEEVAEWISDYWLRCNDINRGTIIFTTAWDQVKFQKKYKRTFDSHSMHKDNTVVVVLLTSNSISLQYIN